MKNIWKKTVCIALSLASVLLLATGCKQEEVQAPVEQTAPTSALRGKYLSSTVIGTLEDKLYITTDPTKVDSASAKYLYWTDAYPFNTALSSQKSPDRKSELVHWNLAPCRISYGVEQSLQLKKDFTYRYQYSINIGNIEEWGGQIASVEVEMIGTFTYRAHGEGYYVNLSNPTDGSETVYGVKYSGNHYIKNRVDQWSRASTPGLEVDLGFLHENCLPFDEFTSARRVYVYETQTEDGKKEKHIEADLYDGQIFNKLIFEYSTYADYQFPETLYGE